MVETKRLTQENITNALIGKIEDGATLITDKHPCYKAFGKANPAITPKSVRAIDHVDKQDRGVHLKSNSCSIKKVHWEI